MLNSKSYEGLTNGCQGHCFEPWGQTGYLSIEVLPFLIGRKWNDIALGFCHGLRPSIIRVVKDGTQLDSRLWRVTVYVTEDGKIKLITQEVEVGLPDGIKNGYELNKALKNN